MIDYDLHEQHNDLPAQADGVLDPVTQEIKIELARLEQQIGPEFVIHKERLIESAAVQRAKAALHRLDSSKPASFYCHAVGLLDALNAVFAELSHNDVIARHCTFLAELITDLREQRRTARALMVRAMRAVFNIPLFLDGPELSGYRHRLR